MHSSDREIPSQVGQPFEHPKIVSEDTWETKTLSKSSQETSQQPNKFLWKELVDRLRDDLNLRELLKTEMHFLSVSRDTFGRFKNVSPVVCDLASEFGNQNCIRAISVIENLTHVKKNQYKFMYEGLTLFSAVDLLIEETRFLSKSLAKNRASSQLFLKLVRTWVDYLNVIHKIPDDAREELTTEIVQRAALVNNIRPSPKGKKVSA